MTAADNARALTMEPVLRAHLRSFPLCQYRQGWRFLSYQQASDFEDCVVQEIVSGIEQRIRCRYLVSCDGAESRIRRAMEATLDGRELWLHHSVLRPDGDLDATAYPSEPRP